MGWVEFLWIVVMVGVFLVNWMSGSPRARVGGPAANSAAAAMGLGALLMEYVPWLMLGGFVIHFVVRTVRHQRRAIWEADSTIHRPRTVTAFAEGVMIADPFTQAHVRWGAFVGFEETGHLFLLYIGRFTAYFVPKRAFGSEGEVVQFRELCRHSIAAPQVGFPVMQPALNPPPN
jgi:hypothetical protein